MGKKIKVGGMTLLAIAVLAVIAISGQADEEKPHFKAQSTVEINEKHVTFDELGFYEATGANDLFKAFGVNISCKKSEFKGEIPLGGSTTMEITPHYSECNGLEGFLLTTITTNSCLFRLKLGEKIVADKYSLSTDIVCGGGGKIEFHVYSSQAADNEKKSLCTMTVGPQENLKGLTATVNTAIFPTDVTIAGELTGIAITKDGSAFPCPPGNEGVASYKIAGEKGLTVQTREEGGETIDFTIN
jgi:hypothetical protein